MDNAKGIEQLENKVNALFRPGFTNLRYRFNVSFTIANVTFVHFCVSPTFVRQNGPLNRALN